MTISEFIAQLQVIKAQYGDLQVEVIGSTEARPTVMDQFSAETFSTDGKVVVIE